MNILSSISSAVTKVEHALAIGAQSIVKIGQWFVNEAKPALQAAGASETVIESASALVCPQAVSIERVGFALLGAVCKAIDHGAAAAAEGGLNITLDAALVADLKSLIPIIKAQAPAVTPVPTTPTV